MIITIDLLGLYWSGVIIFAVSILPRFTLRAWAFWILLIAGIGFLWPFWILIAVINGIKGAYRAIYNFRPRAEKRR